MAKAKRTRAAVSPNTKSLAATFTLKPDAAASEQPAACEARIRRVVGRVEQELNLKAKDLNIFPLIQSFAIRAAPEVVRRLAEQPEVAAAMPSTPKEDLMIRPIRRKEVKLEGGTTKRSASLKARKTSAGRKR